MKRCNNQLCKELGFHAPGCDATRAPVPPPDDEEEVMPDASLSDDSVTEG